MKLWMKCLWLLVVPVVLQGCASGSYELTGKKRPAIDESQVTVFEEAPRFSYEVVGTVTSSGKNGFSDESRREKAINELKAEAAKIGANGVILQKVKQSSFKSNGIGLGLSLGSGGIGTGIGSGFSLPAAQAMGQAIYYSVTNTPIANSPADSGAATNNE